MRHDGYAAFANLTTKTYIKKGDVYQRLLFLFVMLMGLDHKPDATKQFSRDQRKKTGLLLFASIRNCVSV